MKEIAGFKRKDKRSILSLRGLYLRTLTHTTKEDGVIHYQIDLYRSVTQGIANQLQRYCATRKETIGEEFRSSHSRFIPLRAVGNHSALSSVDPNKALMIFLGM